jgi:hypothetical protein
VAADDRELMTTVLLYDPLLLSEIDSSVKPREPRFTGALRTLLECVRQQARRDERNRLLVRITVMRLLRNQHLEACSRLVGCSFEDLLTPSDWEKCKKQVVPKLASRFVELTTQGKAWSSPGLYQIRFQPLAIP